MSSRALSALLWAILALPCPLVAQGYAAASAGVEEAVVALELSRLDERIITVDRDGGVAWIPLREVAALTGYKYRDTPTAGALLRGSEEVAVFTAAAGTHRDPTGWLVRSDSLAERLGFDIAVDWEELRIVLLDPGSTPAAQRVARERRQRELLRQAATAPLTARAARPLLDGLALEYGVGMSPSGSVDRVLTTVGTSVLGGGLSLQLDHAGATRVDGSWTSSWTGDRVVSQVRLGDGIASGPRPRSLRGVTVSNSPLTRFEDLGALPVTGQVGAGWEVEAYRGGRLVAVQQADALGRYRFDVPVRIGENPVSVVAYGPSGERRESSRSLTIDEDVTRPGRFEYAISAGECRSAECQATGNLDGRFGVAPGWTVRGGYDGFTRDTLPDLHHPYAGFTGRLANQLWLDGELVVDASRQIGLRYEPSAALTVRTEYFKFDEGVRQPILTIAGRGSQFTSSAFWRPGGVYGSTSLELSTDYVTGSAGTITSARFTAGLNAGPFRLLPSARILTTEMAGVSTVTRSVGITAMRFPTMRGSGIPLLGRAILRATAEADPTAGFQTAGLFAAWPASRTGQFEVGATWNRNAGTSLTVRSMISLGGARLFGSVTRRPDGSVESNPYLQGMLYLDPSGGVRSSPEIGGDRAGVTGIVWVDTDGDGVMDPDEEPAPGVRLEIGARSVITDREGRYETFGFAPYLPIRMSIDSMSFPSPLLVASLPDSGIAVAPFRLERINLALTPGGVVDGIVRHDDGSPAPGIEVTLCRIGTSDCRTMRSYADGAIYELGLRPGRWRASTDGAPIGTVEVRAGQSSRAELRLPRRQMVAVETWQRPLIGDDAAAAPTAVVASPVPVDTVAVRVTEAGMDAAAAPTTARDDGIMDAASPSPPEPVRTESTTPEADVPAEGTRIVDAPVLPTPTQERPVPPTRELRGREWLERRDPFDRPRRVWNYLEP